MSPPGITSVLSRMRPSCPRPALVTIIHGFVVRALLAASLSIATLGMPQRAYAQDVDPLIEARSKFQRAIELEQASNYAGALKLFREVGAVKMTPQVRYHIATCEENLGQLVAALGGYELAMSTGDQMPAEFIAEVQTSIDELKARIPKLIIERGEGAEAATIELDGVALGQASIGVEVPLNPGPHSVIAQAPGYENFQQTVTVVEGSTETLSVVLQETPAVEVKPEIVPPPAPSKPQPQFGALPWIVGGSGIVLSIVGGTLLGVSQVNAGKVKDLCDGTDCSSLQDDELDKARSLYDSARVFEIAGWASLGVGLAAVGTGAVMYYLDAKRAKRSAHLETGRTGLQAGRAGRATDRSAQATRTLVLPSVSSREVGLNLVGTF